MYTSFGRFSSAIPWSKRWRLRDWAWRQTYYCIFCSKLLWPGNWIAHLKRSYLFLFIKKKLVLVVPLRFFLYLKHAIYALCRWVTKVPSFDLKPLIWSRILLHSQQWSVPSSRLFFFFPIYILFNWGSDFVRAGKVVKDCLLKFCDSDCQS